MRLPPRNPTSNWAEKQRRLAASFGLIDPSKLGGWDTDVATTATAASFAAPAVAGTGAATLLASLAGRYQLSTGATAASSVRLFQSNLTVQPNTDKFFVSARQRLVTTTDANSDNRICGVIAILASAYLCLRMTSNVLNLELCNGGVKTTVATSWTPETANYHDFAIASNLSAVYAFVDGVMVGFTSTLANLSNQACNFEVNVQNGATAADQQTIIDKAALFTQAP